MKISTQSITVNTKGFTDLINITGSIEEALRKEKLIEGQVTVFVVGSTAAISCFEYEPGLKKDMARLYETLASKRAEYKHHETWGDDNGHSHVRAALQGPSVTIPFVNGKLTLGTWQQVVLTDFDTRARERQIVMQFIGRT